MEFEAVNDQRLNRFEPKYKPIYNALIEKYFTERAKTIWPEFTLTSDNVVLDSVSGHKGLKLADFFNIYFVMFDDLWEYAVLKISVDWYGKLTAIDCWNKRTYTKYHTPNYSKVTGSYWRQHP